MAARSMGPPAGDAQALSEGGYLEASQYQQMAAPQVPGVGTQLRFAETPGNGKAGPSEVRPALRVKSPEPAVVTVMTPGDQTDPPSSALRPVAEVASTPIPGPQLSQGSRKGPLPPKGARAPAEVAPRESMDSGVNHREDWSLAQLRPLVGEGRQPPKTPSPVDHAAINWPGTRPLKVSTVHRDTSSQRQPSSHGLCRLRVNEVRQLTRRRATSAEIKLFKSWSLEFPNPLVVKGADGGLITLRGERLISAAAAVGAVVQAEIFVTTTPEETALAVLRATSSYALAGRNPIVRVDQVVTLISRGWTAADIAARVGWTNARISQLTTVAALAETCPQAWRAFRAGWISELTAVYVSRRIRIEPLASIKADEVIERAASAPLTTRRWRRELLAELEAALGTGPSAATTGAAPRTASAARSGPDGTTNSTRRRRSTDLNPRIRQREGQMELFDLGDSGAAAPPPAA